MNSYFHGGLALQSTVQFTVDSIIVSYMNTPLRDRVQLINQP